MKIGISSAETSGDLLAAALIKSIKKNSPKVTIEGMAGDKMLDAGCQKRWDMNQANVMGFSEVLKKLPALVSLRKSIIRYFSQNRPDVFIGVDSPDFNFVIENKLKQKGVKTVHFVSPSIWAWRQSRVKNIKKSTDLMLCVFPFEVDFYRQYNMNALFVGHPLADVLAPRKAHKHNKKILLMPGSREGEIKRLLPEMLLAANEMRQQDSEYQFHLALANDNLLEWALEQTIKMGIEVSTGDAHTRIAQSDLVVVASGTATLEVALIGVPMVVVYKLSTLSYWIASLLVKTKFVSLPNLIANKSLVPELIQHQANGKQIAKTAREVLSGDHEMLSEAFLDIHKQLKHNAADSAAKAILKFAHE